MSDRRREFFTAMADLMEKYEVEIECREECQDYMGCIADGLDFDFDTSGLGDGESVTSHGRYFDAESIRRLAEDDTV